jgi:NAD(P)-dependent dehydrogenase (short-subunit alcohol dehydrogenase family)
VDTSLEGKVAIVTGGTRGIGLAIARLLGAKGASVAVCGTDAGAIARAAETLGASGVRHLALAADVRDEAQVAELVRRTVERFGGLDILVNNAGIGHFVPVADTRPEDWRRVIDINLNGVFFCSREAIPHLRARGGGWIVNVSSLAGKNTFPGGGVYCASKWGLTALSEVMMEELRADNIRVSYVMPGSVATGFNNRVAGPSDDWKLTADDIAQVVGDLLAHPARSLPSRVEIRPSRPPRKG